MRHHLQIHDCYYPYLGNVSSCIGAHFRQLKIGWHYKKCLLIVHCKQIICIMRSKGIECLKFVMFLFIGNIDLALLDLGVGTFFVFEYFVAEVDCFERLDFVGNFIVAAVD